MRSTLADYGGVGISTSILGYDFGYGGSGVCLEFQAPGGWRVIGQASGGSARP